MISSEHLAIKVKNVSKVFYSYSKPRYKLQEMLRPVLGKVHSRFNRHYANEFWALKDVSFEVKKGEAFGIIGINGAGKSTLLQIIAGTLNPSVGDVTVNGRVNALLELGSGFNPEFTGRENVYMNGSILGFTKEYIDQKFQDILDFSEIGHFIDQPVRTYSSGMFVRLAFSVQALMEPDILIVDEALSVGDIFFQQKCAAKMEALRAKGTTLLFVTHDMSAIEKYCSKAILLDKGKVLQLGLPREVIAKYYFLSSNSEIDSRWVPAESNEQPTQNDDREKNTLSKIAFGKLPIPYNPNRESRISPKSELLGDVTAVKVLSASLFDETFQPTNIFEVGTSCKLLVECEILKDIDLMPCTYIIIVNKNNIVMYCKGSWATRVRLPDSARKGQIIRFLHTVKLDITADEYLISIGTEFLPKHICESIDTISISQFDQNILHNQSLASALSFRVTHRKKGLETLFYGLCDLEHELEAEVLESQII